MANIIFPTDTPLVIPVAGDLIMISDTSDGGKLKEADVNNFAPALGADDNYVTDAQLVVIGNTSGTNTGDNAVNTLYSGLAASKENTITGTSSTDYWNGAKAFVDFATSVRAAVLTGLSLATNQAVTATDTVLQAIGYLQKQITDLIATVALKATIASPTFTGTVTLPTTQLGESSLKLDATLSADEKRSGITTTGTAGATIAVGDICYLASSGKWLLTDGILDGTDTGFSKQLGICILASTDTNPTEMLLYGKVRSAAFPSFTTGSPLYLSNTDGDITGTQPATSNHAIRIVGFALSADDLMFNPSNDWIVRT